MPGFMRIGQDSLINAVAPGKETVEFDFIPCIMALNTQKMEDRDWVIDTLDLKYGEPFIGLVNAYKRAIGEEPLNREDIESLFRAVRDEHIQFFTAMEGETLAGMCSLCRTFSTFHCAFGGIFEDFYVEPAFRGKGVARKLVSAVINECKRTGITSLWVGCADADVQMYKSLGFEIPLGNLLAWADA